MTNFNGLKQANMLDERMTLAVQLHNEGVKGNEAAVMEANQLFEQLRKDYPNYPLLDAYYGSSIILMARDKINPFDKLRGANSGLKHLDDAVASDPHNTAIRMLRGKNAYKLPEQHFHRTQTAIEDYTFLIKQQLIQEHIFDANLFSQLLDELGEAYARIGLNEEASAYWSRLENQTQNPGLKQLFSQKRQSQINKPAIESPLSDGENSISLLIEGTRSIGNALLIWSGEGKKSEKAKGKNKDNKKHKLKINPKESSKEKLKEKAKKTAKAKQNNKIKSGKKIIRIKN